MNNSAAAAMPAEELIFHDGLGDRLLIRDMTGQPLHESLLIRADLSAVPSFEFALNDRLSLLAHFDHAAFVRARRILRVPGPLPRLDIVGDYAGGTRLSDVLAFVETSHTAIETGAVLFVAREILEALSALHRERPGMAHGALAPERVIVNGKVRVTDYVLGSAIEQLRYSPERYWKDLRVAVPASAGVARLDRRADVAGVGMLALALFAGRQLSAAEHLGNLSEALMGVTLPDPIKNWLLRMLYLDARRAYVNATEAAQGLEDAVAESTIRPVPLVLASLGIRTQRVNTTVTVRTAEPRPLRPVPVKKPAPRAVPQDPWIAHDVDRRVPTSAAIIDEDRPGRFGNRFRTIVKIGILGAALAGAFTVAQFLPPPAFLFSKTGILAVETNPVGAQLLVDGTDRGVTPLTLKLESGGHDVEVRSSGRSRAFHVYVSSGSNVTQHVELRNAPRIRKSD